MKQLVHILTGWSKSLGLIPTTTAEAKLSKMRLDICSACIYAKKSKALQIIKGQGEYVDALYCPFCSCPCVEASLVVDKECPKKYW